MASKYYPDYAGQVPLLLKLNSKTDVPPSDEAFSPCNATVEDAVRLGADAVGYTLYVGSPKQDDDFIQLGQGPPGLRPLRDAARDLGLPARRATSRRRAARTRFYAIDYAARVAMEMGADIVKLNMPKLDPEKDKNSPAPYNEMEVTQEEAIRHCVESAGRALVVLSGGSKIDDDKLLEQTRMIMEAGGSGVIFGRNVWQREWGEALRIIEQIKETLLKSRHAHPVAGRGRSSRYQVPPDCAEQPPLAAVPVEQRAGRRAVRGARERELGGAAVAGRGHGHLIAVVARGDRAGAPPALFSVGSIDCSSPTVQAA